MVCILLPYRHGSSSNVHQRVVHACWNLSSHCTVSILEVSITKLIFECLRYKNIRHASLGFLLVYPFVPQWEHDFPDVPWTMGKSLLPLDPQVVGRSLNCIPYDVVDCFISSKTDFYTVFPNEAIYLILSASFVAKLYYTYTLATH